MKRLKVEVLKNPWVILLSIFIGVALGTNSPRLSSVLEPFGRMYLYLLQMCVIPILFCAIVSSFGQLIKSKGAKAMLVKMVAVMAIMLSLTSLVGASMAILGKPGSNLGAESKKVLGSIVKQSEYAPDLEVYLDSIQVEEENTSLLDFFTRIIPSNIFEALGSGKTIEILFFSIILGLALGFTPSQESNSLIRLFATLFETFQKIVHWAMYALPFGLICLLAGQISKVGIDVLLSMLRFIVVFYIAGLILSLVNYIIIWKKSGLGVKKVYKACVSPSVIALATTNSFATLPLAIDALIELKFGKNIVNLFTPVGVTIGRYGNVMFFALASIFVAQIYEVELSIAEYIIVFVGSILGGIATTGATGIVTLSMISIVLGALNLPVETVVIIFMAIDPIIDPLRSLLIINTNMAATSMIAEGKKARV